jgi:DNA-binding FadR family transcriptional regulator
VVNAVDASHFGRWATFYFHLSRATFLELLEARIVIEPVMAGLAATRRDSAMLAELEAITARTHVVAVKDDEDYRSVARDFHALVTGMSGNRVLDLFGQALQTIYTGRVQSHALRPKARQQVLDDHDAITAAITAGDADKAQRLMREHMLELKRQVERVNPGALRDIVDWL